MEYKDNDVCRWQYKNTGGMFEPYWCKSQIAVFKAGTWFDTFWSNELDRFPLPAKNIEIRYLGNLDDFKPCKSYDFDYYDDKDCLDLSHSNNSGQYYARKDAVKSVDKIRAVLENNLRDAESKKQNAEYEIQRIKEKLENVTPDTWI